MRREYSTEPYLYLWIDTGTWVEEYQCHKRYLGVHNGNHGYRYTGSGTYFKEAYSERPDDFQRTIIMHDTDYGFIKGQEEKILVAVEASANTAWYNAVEEMGCFSMTGKKHTPETIAKMSNTARNRSPEHRAKLSKAHVGKKQSPEHIEKKRRAWIGRNHSDETRAKMSIIASNRSDEYRAKQSASQKGKKRSPEICQKIAEIQRNMPRLTCPHCSREFHPSHYGRYHGDRCKEKTLPN